MDGTVASAEAKKDKDVKPKVTAADIKTCPPDSRFPATSQTKNCFTKYVEYHKCIQEHGDGDSRCEKYRRAYKSLCPISWVEAWDDQRANDVFTGPF